jgi:hypothetical protein
MAGYEDEDSRGCQFVSSLFDFSRKKCMMLPLQIESKPLTRKAI